MLIIRKYDNRKLYNTDTSRYTTVQELAKLSMGSFKVLEFGTDRDVTTDILLGSLANSQVLISNEVKVKVMQFCIEELNNTPV